LSAFIVLHLSIFALTGIFFWKWIALDAVLVVVLARFSFDFEPRMLVAGLLAVLVLQSQVTVNLAWVDSPVTHVFDVIAVDEEGNEFVVPERYFAPFELVVAQDRFGYLTEIPLIANAYGSLDRAVAADAIDGLTRENFASRRDEFGVIKFSEYRSLIFDEFIRSQCRRWTGRRWLDGWPLVPPPHVWTTDPNDNPKPPDEIDYVVIRLETWVLDDLTAGPVESSTVRRIPVGRSC
jgi:hypothetical protein